jgi:hypothetical protein
MELLDVTLTTIQRRNRAAFVPSSEAPGLVPGQRVVLRDEEGEFFAGSVVDHDERDGDARYLVHVGVRLPEEYAMLRLGRVPRARAGADDYLQALLDLLGEARDSTAGKVPVQRLG